MNPRLAAKNPAQLGRENVQCMKANIALVATHVADLADKKGSKVFRHALDFVRSASGCPVWICFSGHCYQTLFTSATTHITSCK